MARLHDCTSECPPSHREHLNHMTDGRWHDDCRFCLRRREKGGTGLEDEVPPTACTDTSAPLVPHKPKEG